MFADTATALCPKNPPEHDLMVFASWHLSVSFIGNEFCEVKKRAETPAQLLGYLEHNKRKRSDSLTVLLEVVCATMFG